MSGPVTGDLLSALEGLAFGDRGYIGKKLFKKRLQLITRKRKSIKETLELTKTAVK